VVFITYPDVIRSEPSKLPSESLAGLMTLRKFAACAFSYEITASAFATGPSG